MKNQFVIFCLLTTLISCSKIEEKDVEIVLECRGKTQYSQNSSQWNREKISTYETVEVYEIKKDIETKNGKKWSFKNGNHRYFDDIGDSTTQPGNPNWYRSVSVTDSEIILIKRGGNGFDEKKKDNNRMNQKMEYRDENKINRISGEWIENNITKTEWKDGSWFTNSWYTTGKCEKGIKKF